MLRELPVYNELNIVKTSKAYKEHARSYSIEIINSKDVSIQLIISKSSIEDFFKDLLNEIKNQITLNVLLSKYKKKKKKNSNWEFATVCFNSTSKTVISPKYSLGKQFQEVFHKIDNWINEKSGWIIESIDTEYVNFYIYNLLWRTSYTELSKNLKNQKKFDHCLKQWQKMLSLVSH